MTLAYKAGKRLECVFDDTKPTNLESGWRALETDTQIEYYWDGSTWQILTIPFGKKVGIWEGVSTGAGFSGLLSGNLATTTISGTQVKNFDSNGLYSTFPTTAILNAVAGISSGTITERDLNPLLLIKFRLNTLVHCRFVAGFTTLSSLAIGSDMLANQSGVLLFFDDNASGGNWKTLRNSGSASSTPVDTGVAADSLIHTLAIKADNANSKFSWSLDGGTPVDLTTAIPAAGTDLRIVWDIEAAEGVIKSCDWFRVIIINDK